MRLVSPLARGKYPSRSSLGEISLLRLLESCAAPLATPCTTRSAVAAANLRALDCVLWTACPGLHAPTCVLRPACSGLRAPPCVLRTACSALRAPPCVLRCPAVAGYAKLPMRPHTASWSCLTLAPPPACAPLAWSAVVLSFRLPLLALARPVACSKCCFFSCVSSPWLVTVLISSGVLNVLLIGGRLGTSNSGEQQEAAGSQGPRR